MVYGIDNHEFSYQSPPSCIRRENNNLNVITCENFNSTNLIHSQISTTTVTQSTRKRNSAVLASADGCNIDLSGLTREERRSKKKI